MQIADKLSRLAGNDLEPSNQLIPISFNVHTRSTRPLKLYYVNKHKAIHQYTLYYQNNYTKNHTYTKPTVVPTKLPQPPKLQPHISKPSISGKIPPVPIGIL